jgi:alpha-L-fucosidase
LIDIVSKGGNFLLNVGPTAEGLIPQPSVERLQAMGKWLRVNGDAIYGANASPVERPEWGRYTQKDNLVYAHIFDWPKNQQLKISGIENIKDAYILTGQGRTKIDLTKSKDGVTVKLPVSAPDPIASVVVLEVGPSL